MDGCTSGFNLLILRKVDFSLQSMQDGAVPFGTALALHANNEWQSTMRMLGRDKVPPFFLLNALLVSSDY